MTAAHATAELCHVQALPPRESRLLPLLLKAEAWLDRRAGRRVLQGLSDHALADLGLSRADVERVSEETAWQRLLLRPAGRR